MRRRKGERKKKLGQKFNLLSRQNVLQTYRLSIPAKTIFTLFIRKSSLFSPSLLPTLSFRYPYKNNRKEAEAHRLKKHINPIPAPCCNNERTNQLGRKNQRLLGVSHCAMLLKMDLGRNFVQFSTFLLPQWIPYLSAWAT